MNRSRRQALVRIAAGAVAAGCVGHASPSGAQSGSARIARFSDRTPGDRLPPGWAPLVLRGIAPSRYALVQDDARVVVRAEASASASGIAFRFPTALAEARRLRWQWKAERLPDGADTRLRLADDAVARLYVTFRQPPERVGPVQRAADEMARLVLGEAPPHATLLYVWDNQARVGDVFANPYTDRVRNVVVERGNARLGHWQSYERDVADDYRAAFGERPPPLSGVALMADADNTSSSAVAWYGDVTLGDG